MEREYIVTLKSKNDLISFYQDMETSGGPQHIPDREVELKERRAISRNTHYLLTHEEAEELRKDDRVLAVELTPKERGLRTIRFGSYTVSGNFDKTPDTVSDINWGILHCAGNQSQRRKGFFGTDMMHEFSDTVTVFNDGENVDVVIIDEPVAYDHQEFLDPDTNQTRFVQYQWYSQLDQYMVLLDTQESDLTYQNFISNNTDLPYYNCPQLSSSGYNLLHGTHVAGTAVGKFQGWARKSNLYSIPVALGSVVQSIGQQNAMEDTKVFDYLRAFHLYKPDNINTGKRNPTVTNHSWGYGYYFQMSNLSSITSVNFRGDVNYKPTDRAWTISELGSNFGIYVKFENGVYKISIPDKVLSLEADVQDAIDDGVIVVTAAGNDNYYGVPSGHQDYNNTVTIGNETIYYNRGTSPGATLDAINVGNISAKSDFRRHETSNFGPIVNVFAPGENIHSSLPYSHQYYYGTGTGTSFAAPQVAGIIACFCTNRDGREVNNARALQYLQDMGIDGEITEDVNGGSLSDNTTLRDSPNLTAASRERRDEYSILSFNDLPRESEGVVYPRKKIGKKS